MPQVTIQPLRLQRIDHSAGRIVGGNHGGMPSCHVEIGDESRTTGSLTALTWLFAWLFVVAAIAGLFSELMD